MKVRSRKRKSGAVVWFMDYRIGGQRVQKMIPAVKTRREAQEVADRLWAALKHREVLGTWLDRLRSRTA